MQMNDSDSPPGMKIFWGPGRTWEDNPKIDLQELDVRMCDWIIQARERTSCRLFLCQVS